MNEFFKLKVSYPVMNETGVTSNKNELFLIEAVNYQDAEITALGVVDYYGMNENGEPSFEITKFKTPEIAINNDFSFDFANTDNLDKTETNSGINLLSVVSSQPDTFELANEGHGLYKVQMVGIDIDDKKVKTTIYIYAKSFKEVTNVSCNFIRKYLSGDNTNIKSISKEQINTIILLKETIENATEFYKNIQTINE